MRDATGHPHAVGTPGGECEALATGEVDERHDDVLLACTGVRVVKQLLPGTVDAIARLGPVNAAGERRDFAGLVHRNQPR